MPDNGCTCGNEHFIAVVDKNLEPNYKSGNKFCRYCPECDRRKYCSEQFFENAEEQFAIPMGENNPIPFRECPNCDTKAPMNEECRECGGNVFECPKCGELVGGKPDECPQCNVPYDWSNA